MTLETVMLCLYLSRNQMGRIQTEFTLKVTGIKFVVAFQKPFPLQSGQKSCQIIVGIFRILTL